MPPLCSLEMGRLSSLPWPPELGGCLSPLSCEVEGVQIVLEENTVGHTSEDTVPTLKKGRKAGICLCLLLDPLLTFP